MASNENPGRASQSPSHLPCTYGPVAFGLTLLASMADSSCFGISLHLRSLNLYVSILPFAPFCCSEAACEVPDFAMASAKVVSDDEAGCLDCWSLWWTLEEH